MKHKKAFTDATATAADYRPGGRYAGTFEGYVPNDPKYRALVDWANTLVKAQQIVAANAEKEKTTATAAAILRAGMIARGEVVELPVHRTARAIIAAGRKRRSETGGDQK
jgi:hypothetical protein